MIKHVCVCGYIYNPKYGDIRADVDPGVKFEDLPRDWVCPICGLGKDHFHDENKRIQSEFEDLK
jgi:rubredoxin